MKHTNQTCLHAATRIRDRAPWWRCPDCGGWMLGDRPNGQCPGDRPKTRPITPASDLFCVYRKIDIVLERVPCGKCIKNGMNVSFRIVQCEFGGGRKCSMADLKRDDVTYCGTCRDRKPVAEPPRTEIPSTGTRDVG